MWFLLGSALRRYWMYLALAGLVLLSVTLARRNGALNSEIDRFVSRIDAIKQREVLRDAAKASTDDELVSSIMR